MDHIGHDQHAELGSELGQRFGQGLAVLATLGEAGARLGAEELRRRERRAEQADQQRDTDARRQLAAQQAERRADELAQHAARRRAVADRRLVGQALDEDWLARADLRDLATAWRTARLREQQFPEAHAAAEAVEDRLRQMWPRPMDLYSEAVRRGVPRHEAMAAAAAHMATTPVMRAHGGGRAGALPQPPVVEAAFTAAVSDERIRLATGVDPAAYAQQLGRLGPGGHAAAEALREFLATRAGQELARGRAEAATPDDPDTAGVNEHTSVGMPRNGHQVGDANRDTATAASTRTAAQLAAEWYPDGLQHPAGPPVPRHVATKRPANAATQTATRARRTR